MDETVPRRMESILSRGTRDKPTPRANCVKNGEELSLRRIPPFLSPYANKLDTYGFYDNVCSTIVTPETLRS